MCAIKAVQFVHYKVPEGIGGVVLPQARILRANEQVVEHLVVGKQDVGRGRPHCFAVGDEVGLAHHAGAFGVGPFLSKIEACSDVSSQ